MRDAFSTKQVQISSVQVLVLQLDLQSSDANEMIWQSVRMYYLLIHYSSLCKIQVKMQSVSSLMC
jgi:hypothetical protein